MRTDSFPLAYIVVITFNGKHHLEKCLPSLYATDYPNFRIILLDNASMDGTFEYVQSAYPNVRIHRNPCNFGFAKGNNVAMTAALKDDANYVILLNDDTAILDPQWLRKAIAIAEEDIDTGMVGFDITPDEQKALPSGLEVTEVERIPGCALLIKSGLLQQLGLFDEIYFAYGEESDLEARAIKAGYRLRQINVPLYHKGAGSFSKMPIRFAFLFMRNWLRFSIKNESVLKVLLRPFIVFDLLCNPFPIRNRTEDIAARQKYGANSRSMNFLLLCAAILWNILRLPQTLIHRYDDHRRVVTARISLKRQIGHLCDASSARIEEHASQDAPIHTDNGIRSAR